MHCELLRLLQEEKYTNKLSLCIGFKSIQGDSSGFLYLLRILEFQEIQCPLRKEEKRDHELQLIQLRCFQKCHCVVRFTFDSLWS